jgi:hypothetical protein
MNTGKISSPEPDWLKIVRQHVAPLDYGSVEIVIHDSQIVQIDKTERWRLQKVVRQTRDD